MEVRIEAEILPIKNGVLARGINTGLAANGATNDLALRSLERTLTYWCRGLEREGTLEEALHRRGIAWERTGSDLSVETLAARR